ncbi:uncharacterized protein BYT42DRAFT_535530 [Radiomyces spectabilis]|uniref:uncharacterized protein n=1 Tax=Radiomyces spectabilis TaxID=64574 RepID=UPI0022202F94|nr:uncharacterized protein BYT42DRAFT_535530 [Radiomyces spectabilis]KAI8374424.1 hypothetical protein BYT42DRAFT_535530 [Radiomyces spectabilis]
MAATRKRTHLKPSQVAVLQETFVCNPLPDSSIRSRLSRELGVTERTIQIWFQNRRAKVRKMESACNNPFGGMPALMPNATFRSPLAPEFYDDPLRELHDSIYNRQRPRSSSKPEAKSNDIIDFIPRAMSEGTDREINPGNSYIIPFPATTIRIDTWTRFARSANQSQEWDLTCFGLPYERQLVWQVQDEQNQFRIQIRLDAVNQIRLGQVASDTGHLLGQLEIDVNPHMQTGAVAFSMWRSGIDHQWMQCGDFCESKQASQPCVHTLQGDYDGLRHAIHELVTLVPDLVSKFMMVRQPSSEFDTVAGLCRDLTLSPSATPEPSAAAAAAAVAAQFFTQDSLQKVSDLNNSWMLELPFSNPTSTVGATSIAATPTTTTSLSSTSTTPNNLHHFNTYDTQSSLFFQPLFQHSSQPQQQEHMFTAAPAMLHHAFL